MRKHKISLDKVQEAFNSAIKRRDCRCMIKDYEPCYGQLECSHYFTTGANPSLRFYPLNAYTQCSKHHWKHHNVWVVGENFVSYQDWMKENHKNDLDKMETMRHRFIKYDDDLKAEIISLCKADKLEELTELIEKELLK